MALAMFPSASSPIALLAVCPKAADDVYAIVAQYQAEYRGVVQYYRLAYNLHQLSRLKYVMEVSLVKTLAKKRKTSCQRIYRQIGTTITNEWGTYKVKVIAVRKERGRTNHHWWPTLEASRCAGTSG